MGTRGEIKNVILFNPVGWESAFPVLRVLGPASYTGINVIYGNKGNEIFLNELKQADLVVIQREFPQDIESYKLVISSARKHKVPVIYDLDDLLLELPMSHPDRVTNYYTKALLPIMNAVIEADAVSTSTPTLASYLKAFNNHIYVLKNYLDDRFWKLINPKEPDPSDYEIIIGYMGGDSHVNDIDEISPVLNGLLDRFPGTVKIHFWGLEPPQGISSAENVIWTPLELYNYKQFAEFFQQQKADIFIAPLENNLFNHCKSCIKFLEYGSLGVPGVYSGVDAYKQIVQHGFNGFLAYSLDDWEKYLIQLIDSPTLRYEMAQNAQVTIKQDWLLSNNASNWLDVYTEIKQATPNRIQQVNIYSKAADQIYSWFSSIEKKLVISEIKMEQDESIFREKIENFQDELKTVNDKNQNLLKEIALQNDQIGSITEQLKNERNKIKKLDADLNLELSKIEAYVREIKKVEDDLTKSRIDIEELQTQLESERLRSKRLDDELGKYSSKVSILEGELDLQRGKEKDLRSEIRVSKLQREKLEKIIETEKEKTDALEKELIHKETQIKKLGSDQREATDEYKKVVTEKEKLISELKKEKSDTTDQYNQQLYAIKTSREFIHGIELVRMVDRIAPIGSLQKRTISKSYEWIKGLLQQSKNRDIKILSSTEPKLNRVDGYFNVVVFPIINWHFRFQRPQQLAVRFAREGHRVFYVNLDFLGDDHASVTEIDEHIYEVRLPGSPINVYSERMSNAHKKLIFRAFRDLKNKYEIWDVVCIVDHPFWTPAAIAIKEKLGWKLVYDCMDEHSGFSTSTDDVVKAENKLVRESDLIITTSNLLFKDKFTKAQKCVLVPNAGDFDHFSINPGKIPKELHDVSSPIIGYYGAIAEWFDMNLVAKLAQLKPHWNFVLIGSTAGADLSPISLLENIHLYGEKPYSLLPEYLYSFDVCMIPFKKTPLTEATNPVKMFEYLSAGKPVVATRLTELENYSEQVYLTETVEDWIAAIENSIKSESKNIINSRISFAQDNTWDNRVREIKTHLSGFFTKASIIVLTYNNINLTKQCIESIYQNTKYPNYEVIVVDNASSDGTQKYLQKIGIDNPNLEVILNTENLGFSTGNNRGADRANGEFIVFLNNDTVVTTGWLSRLIQHLNNPKVGIVGPVTNWSGNETKINVDYADLDDMAQFASRYTNEHWGEMFEIRSLPFMCVAMRRKVFNEIGLLDEQYAVGMFEDDDYAMRIRDHGYKVLCAEDVFIHHWGKASFSQIDDEIYQKIFEENKERFELKWGEKWVPHKYRNF